MTPSGDVCEINNGAVAMSGRCLDVGFPFTFGENKYIYIYNIIYICVNICIYIYIHVHTFTDDTTKCDVV